MSRCNPHCPSPCVARLRSRSSRAATVAIQSRLGGFLPPGLDLAGEPLLALDEETALRPEVAIFRNPGPAPEAVVMTAAGHDRNVALKLAAYRRYGASDVVVISPDPRHATVHRSHGAVEVATAP